MCYNLIILCKYSNGITPRKSLTLDVNLDLIPEDLQRHFWRGMIDGDGYIGKYKDGRLYIGLCGSYNMVLKFSIFIEKLLNSKLSPRKMDNIFQICYSSKYTIHIIRLLYENIKTFLDRKNEIFGGINEVFTST